MLTTNTMAVRAPIAAAPMVVFDPALPIPRPAGHLAKAEAAGQNRAIGAR